MNWKREPTHFDDVERVEGMHSTHTASTKEFNAETIETSIESYVFAEFTLTINVGDPPSAFKSDEFFEERGTFCRQRKERVVLASK
jgi:hypothetical protein